MTKEEIEKAFEAEEEKTKGMTAEELKEYKESLDSVFIGAKELIKG